MVSAHVNVSCAETNLERKLTKSLHDQNLYFQCSNESSLAISNLPTVQWCFDTDTVLLRWISWNPKLFPGGFWEDLVWWMSPESEQKPCHKHWDIGRIWPDWPYEYPNRVKLKPYLYNDDDPWKNGSLYLKCPCRSRFFRTWHNRP